MITEEDIMQALEQHENDGDFDAAWEQAAASSRRGPSRRWMNVVVGLAAAAAIIVALLPRSPTPESAAVPGAVDEPGATEEEPVARSQLEVYENQALTVTFTKPVAEVWLDRPDAARLTLLTERILHVLARDSGPATVLHASHVDGSEPTTYELRLREAKDPAASVSADNLMVVEPGGWLTLSGEAPFHAVGPVPEHIATVKLVEGEVRIDGVGPGVTDVVILQTPDSPPSMYELVVREE